MPENGWEQGSTGRRNGTTPGATGLRRMSGLLGTMEAWS